MDIREEIQQALLEGAAAIKEETEEKYGRDSVKSTLEEETIRLSLEGAANVYREIGSVKNPPNPQFYRAYKNQREKILKRIAQGVQKGIKGGF